MKKLLFLALIGLFFGSHLSGCKGISVCTPPLYPCEFVVKNDLDKVFVISFDHPDKELPAITIDPGESKVIHNTHVEGECFTKPILKDIYKSDVGLSFITITIEDKALPESIWLRKNWTFESDYNYIKYTLTIDDDLLAELSKEQMPAP